MKTQSISRFTLMLLVTVVINYSFAQSSTEYVLAKALSKTNVHNTSTEAKKSFNISTKIQQSFLSYFKGTKEVNWDMIDNDYLVSFKTGDMNTRALFSKNGSLQYAIYYGSEKDLPKSTDEQVRSAYYNYQITSAVQININKHNIWIISLKDNTRYIILRIEEGEMAVMQQYHE